ncbi:MAG TPA: APC family permease [Vicinamibacterales bacterium]
MEPSPNVRLVRELGRWDLVALVINSILGAGIFGLPSRAFALAGTYSLLAYVASATAIALVVLCFAEVSSRFSATGGPYLYARTAFGPLIGFQVGWLLWVGRVAASASLANLFVGYVGYFIPDAGAIVLRTSILAILFGVLAAANIRGVRLTATVTNVLTVGKLLPLGLLALAGAFFIGAPRLASATPPSYQGFSEAALLLVFVYTGFEGASIPSGEMRAPARHLPFALLAGFSVVTLVYVAVQIVCIAAVPDLAHSERPVADAALRVLGAPGASLIAAGALVSMAGTLNALMFATPRLLFAMSDNGQLPRALSSTHARLRTPIVAIAFTAVVGFVLAAFSTFLSSLTLSAVVRLLAYATTCVAMPVLRRRSDVAPATFQVPLAVLTLSGALALIVWLLSNSPWNEIRLTAIAIVLGGIFYMWARLPRREVTPAVTVER